MKFSVIVNQNKADADAYASYIECYLTEQNAQVRLFYEAHAEKDAVCDSDFVISIGGDGTMLRTAGILRGAGIPILGINVGHLGYLTEVSRKEEIAAALQALLRGDFQTDSRAMLHGEVLRGGTRIADGLALNELVLTRKEGLKVLRFAVHADGMLLNEYASDGLIVSTPTGSTAYNLSAGGPIVSPGAHVTVLMPICAHALNDRAIVLEDSRVLEILVQTDNQMLAYDGDRVVELLEGDRVRIAKAEARTELVKLRSESFLTTLKEKMTLV